MPRIQVLLRQALDWEARLQAEPGLTQTALAMEAGISRVRVTQILNLLRLTPEIRARILPLPTAAGRGPITETGLRKITGILYPVQQVREFQRMERRKESLDREALAG